MLARPIVSILLGGKCRSQASGKEILGKYTLSVGTTSGVQRRRKRKDRVWKQLDINEIPDKKRPKAIILALAI